MAEETLSLDYCPVCETQIIPKRTAVEVPQDLTTTPHAVPPPPPSSPNQPQRKKHLPPRGGLVQGTGRMRPNGSIKGQPQPTPIKSSYRILIDQGPYPLYCSEDCRLADLQGAFSCDFNPTRHIAPTCPQAVPRSTSTDSESSSASEAELTSTSQSSSDSSDEQIIPRPVHEHPLPPPAPFLPKKRAEKQRPTPFTAGIMVANKYLQATQAVNRDPVTGKAIIDPAKRRAVPGWSDGSSAWRSALYSFSAVPTTATSDVCGVGAFDHLENSSNSTLPCRAYDGFVASPHRAARSRRMQDVSTSAPAPVVEGGFSKSRSESDALLRKYSDSLTRHSESRLSISSLASSTSTTSPTTRSPPKRSSFIPTEAEDKLLVPAVMKRSYSMQSTSSALSTSSTRSRSVAGSMNNIRRSTRVSGLSATRPNGRSPLSLGGAVDEVMSGLNSVSPEDDTVAGNPLKKQETRSWSYDNMPTYAMMKIPPGYGDQSCKKLFLFADKPV